MNIAGTEYSIEQAHDSLWYAISGKYESVGCLTYEQAFQAAVDNEQEKIDRSEQKIIDDLEAEVFGTEENQVFNHYNKVIRS